MGEDWVRYGNIWVVWVDFMVALVPLIVFGFMVSFG